MKLVLELDVNEVPNKEDAGRMLSGMLEAFHAIPYGSDLRSVLNSDEYKDESFMVLAEGYSPDDMDRAQGRLVIMRGEFDTKNYARESKRVGEIITR